MKKISVIVPCHNEEKGIEKVIRSVPISKMRKYGFHLDLIVVNNGSTDKTEERAKKAGAIVINEPIKGKGHAMRSGFQAVSHDTDYVIMLDGDNTYKASEILRMVEPLDSGFCDVVIGSRLGGKLIDGSLSNEHRLANWLYTFLVRRFYQANVTDVLSGYFAWKKKALQNLLPFLESDGFSLEMEMITKMKKLGFDLYSVPITYDRRIGQSKISSLKDGIKISYTLFKNLFWSPDKHIHRGSEIPEAVINRL